MKKKDMITCFCTIGYIVFLFFGLHFYFGKEEEKNHSCAIYMERVADQKDKIINKKLLSMLLTDNNSCESFVMIDKQQLSSDKISCEQTIASGLNLYILSYAF